ncbi:MAG TPA: hypothetical protein VK427_15920, partial [Kofleriaceae bacterium]|nr:hypothetical protein [Kofleriaceae bacterium]
RYCDQLEKEAKPDLAAKRAEKEGAPVKVHAYATQTVGAGAAAIKEFAGIAGPINACTQTVNPSIFADMSDATGKIESAVSAINLLGEMCDRSAFNAFEQDPSFESCAAWGAKVGSLFATASGLADALPSTIAPVYRGVLNTPQRVISAFTSVVRDYYANVDKMTKDGCAGKSELLAPGEASTCKNTH